MSTDNGWFGGFRYLTPPNDVLYVIVDSDGERKVIRELTLNQTL